MAVSAVSVSTLLPPLFLFCISRAALSSLPVGMAAFGKVCLLRRSHEALGENSTRYLDFQQVFNFTERRDIALAHQRHGATFAPCACRSADAVHVVFSIVRHVVIDDKFDIVDVYSSRNNVGGDKDVNAPGFEREHDFIALLLLEVGMHGRGVIASARLEPCDESTCFTSAVLSLSLHT